MNQGRSVVRQGDSVHMQVGNTVARCAIMLVGPELAREWLLLEHPKNRRTPSVTAKYAAEMSAGGWRPSPEPIVFSQSGHLINGGNRIRAVIESGETILLTVWWDWPDDAFQCLDRNAPRSIYQSDAMTGDAMPRTVYQMARGMVLIDENRTTISDTEVRDRAKVLLEPWASIGATLSQIKIGKSGIRASASLACCVAWLSDSELATRFVLELESAAQHARVPCVAVKNFLRWYENTKVATGSYGVKDTAFGTCSALRQYATNGSASFVKPTADAWLFWRNRRRTVDAFETMSVPTPSAAGQAATKA